MELLLDTANLIAIKKGVDYLPLAGVTSNPSIIKREGKIDFFEHMRTIRSIIGKERSLHIQVVATEYEQMLADAKRIITEIDPEVYIKVPVNQTGLKVIKELKRQGIKVTATAIYTEFQGYLAIASGADYLAPYFNRMENANIDAKQIITNLAKEIQRTQQNSKILAASFKNIGQANAAIQAGAQALTLGVDVVEQAFSMPSIQQAITDFTNDWEETFGKGQSIYQLKD